MVLAVSCDMPNAFGSLDTHLSSARAVGGHLYFFLVASEANGVRY